VVGGGEGDVVGGTQSGGTQFGECPGGNTVVGSRDGDGAAVDAQTRGLPVY
jgi:hypothetical protein